MGEVSGRDHPLPLTGAGAVSGGVAPSGVAAANIFSYVKIENTKKKKKTKSPRRA